MVALRFLGAFEDKGGAKPWLELSHNFAAVEVSDGSRWGVQESPPNKLRLVYDLTNQISIGGQFDRAVLKYNLDIIER